MTILHPPHIHQPPLGQLSANTLGQALPWIYAALLAAALCLAFTACSNPRQEQRLSASNESLIESPVEDLRDRYVSAMLQARLWLDALHVDPLELRARGIKGKKKLVEQLDAYYRLWLVSEPAERETLLLRVEQVAAVTSRPEYHDLDRVDERTLRQDSTSYFRAALLLERMGLDTRYYREQIRAAQPRIDAHLASRGAHQQRAFHWYYQHFGLKPPFPLQTAMEQGVIAGRRPPATLQAMDVYALTHEIYVLYEFGDLTEVEPFDCDAQRYLAEALPLLVRAQIAADNPDLLGELVECMHYLRRERDPAYRSGVEVLLDAQNSDGSWGHYPDQRQRLGDFVEQGFVLHTTLVAIGALTAIFDRPMSVPSRDCFSLP